MTAAPPDVFLSYSREDQATTRRFAEALQREGFSVWWDQALQPGEVYDKVTEQALEQARAVVVLWSKASVESRWVRSEATTADRNGTMVPVMIEDCRRPVQFELMHSVDLSRWKGDADEPAFRALVARVGQLVGREARAAPSQPAVRRRGPALVAFIAMLALALVAAGGVYLWHERAAAQPDVAAEDPSIAVLPFTNMSSDKEQEYFSDGLTEELLNQLAQVPQLRVIGRTSSFAFKGRSEDLRRIGEILGVNHILEGSVRKSGDRVRITAQLINAADGSHVWSEAYERRLDDIFAIQDEIARTVAEQLQVRLGVQDLHSAGTTNILAYDEYLAGLALTRSIDAGSQTRALPRFERALQLDPGFLNAKLRLVEALSRLTSTGQGEIGTLQQRQDVLIDEISRSVPGSPEADLALSYRAGRGRDLVESERLLKGALRNAGDRGRQARLRYSQFLWGLGQNKQARIELAPALRDDPLDIYARVLLFAIYEASRQFDLAEQEQLRLRELPGGATIQTLGGWVFLAMDRRDVSALRQAAEKLVAVGAGQAFLPELLASNMEDFNVARQVIRRHVAANGFPENPVVGIRLTMWTEFFGDRELTRQALKAVEGQEMNFDRLAENLWRPVFAGLWNDPAFKLIFRKTGIADYWRTTGNWGDFCKPVGDDDFECR